MRASRRLEEMTSAGLTRRAFLARAGRIGAAAGVAGFIVLDPLGGSDTAAGRLRKCVSLGGPGPLRQDGHPDDYRLWGNREYIRDLSGSTWVKLWVSWYDLQEELGTQPASRASSWRHLDTAPGGQSWLRRLDGQARAANDDGLGVILSVHHTHPTWSSGATGPSPVDPAKTAAQKLPLDISTDGPWAWFVGYLLARYRPRAAVNPDGASIDALEICNEPNYLAWPQEGIALAVAQMIRSATALSASSGGTPILAPATSDFPDSTRRTPAGVRDTVWSEFTSGVLAALRGYRSPVPLRWSHHNYREVRFADSRTIDALSMLRGSGWSSDVAPLWLTEGGLNMGSKVEEPGEREFQASAIERSFSDALGLADVYLWTQHTITDKPGNSFKSGLRDDFAPGRGPGGRRPSWYAWRGLPGAPEP